VTRWMWAHRAKESRRMKRKIIKRFPSLYLLSSVRFIFLAHKGKERTR
jgi:hypothetical protein